MVNIIKPGKRGDYHAPRLLSAAWDQVREIDANSFCGRLHQFYFASMGAQRAEARLQQLESPSNKPHTSIEWETPNMGTKITANFLFTVKQNSF